MSARRQILSFKPHSSSSGKGQGKGKGDTSKVEDGSKKHKVNKYKLKALAAKEKESKDSQYRDRAKERRETVGEYEKVAAEFENYGEVSVDQSKYLGGDLDHTHLVKGLDFALLNKVRAELTKQQKVDEFVKAKQERKAAGGQKKRVFQTVLAKNIFSAVVETLHPHHTTFKERLQKMGKAISYGQRIRGAPSVFLPGRMFYEFDTGLEMEKSDIPRIVYSSKEEAPRSELMKRPSGILQASITKVKASLLHAKEERKQRKLQKSLGAEASYTAAQKIVVDKKKYKAKDSEDDIFSGVGAFDVGEVVRKARAEQAARKAQEVC